jgi:hypothetical protein
MLFISQNAPHVASYALLAVQYAKYLAPDMRRKNNEFCI